MKFANDIRSLLEDDIGKLTQGLLTGEVGLADGRGLLDMGLTEIDVHHLAGEVLRYRLEKPLLSVLMAALGSMKWLTMAEAEMYSRKSRNTLIALYEKGLIEAKPPRNKKKGGQGGDGEWIFDRQSIDSYYNSSRDYEKIYAQEEAP